MKFWLEAEGLNHLVHAEKIGSQLWIHWPGRTVVVDQDPRRSQRRKQSGQAAGDLLAPMPGKITQILKAVGEAVAQGDAVVMMEAMKMEYTLKASAAGSVQSVGCTVGQQVSVGQVLVQFNFAAQVKS